MSKSKANLGQDDGETLTRANLDQEVDQGESDNDGNSEDDEGHRSLGGGSDVDHKPRSRPKKPPRRTPVGEVKRRRTGGADSPVAGPSSVSPLKSGESSAGGMEWMDDVSDTSAEEAEGTGSVVEESLANLRHRRQPTIITPSASSDPSGGPGRMGTDGVFDEAIEKLAEATKRYQQGVEEDIQVASTSTRPAGVVVQGGSGVREYFRNPIFEAGEEDEGRGEGIQQGQEGLGWGLSGNAAVAAAGAFPAEDEGKSLEMTVTAAAQEEQERLVWARKMFRRTFDHVFPGFSQGAAINNVKMDHEYPLMCPVSFRCSAPLQGLLRAEAMFFFMWLLSFVYTYDIRIGVLKELHGNLVLCMAALFSVVNIPRIFMGLRASLNEKLEMLALFWMMTFIVQLPLFGFIVFTDLFTSVKLPFTIIMDGVVMTFIVLEIAASTIHLQLMVSGELAIIELARKSMESNRRKPKKKSRSKVVRTAEEGVVGSALEDLGKVSDNSSNTSSESDDSDDIEYSMEIRRLPGESNTEDGTGQPERDDSNQVSSTSDSIRQRPIPVL